MKCPRCGHEMVLDGHRKIDLMMCYDCGYIEGCAIEESPRQATNFERLRGMNMNETIAFLSGGLGLDERKIASWMDSANAID